MPSLGTGEISYALLQAAVLPGGRGVAAHDLRGQPEALILQVLYLPAHLLWPHAALLCGHPSCAAPTAAGIFRAWFMGFMATGSRGCLQISRAVMLSISRWRGTVVCLPVLVFRKTGCFEPSRCSTQPWFLRWLRSWRRFTASALPRGPVVFELLLEVDGQDVANHLGPVAFATGLFGNFVEPHEPATFYLV